MCKKLSIVSNWLLVKHLNIASVLHVEVLAHHVINFGLVASINSWAYHLLVQHLVGLVDILCESTHLTSLIFCQIFIGLVKVVVIKLGGSLSTFVIAFSSHLARLLDCIDTQDSKVCLLPELLFFGRYLKELGNNANMPRTIHRCKANLSLERYLG